MSLFVAGFLSLLSLSTVVAATIDQNWESRFVLAPGLNGEVYSMVAIGTNLYTGGAFTKAGDIQARGLARWDGHQWNSVGGSVDGVVFALATDGVNLYAGGRFNSAGGIATTNIALWNGTNWSSIGALRYPSALNPSQTAVYCLLIDGTNLFAGGTFSHAGTVTVTNVARWDGATWHPLGDGLGIIEYRDDSFAVFSLVRHGSYLFASGFFPTSGSIDMNNVASWDGINWAPLGDGISGGTISYQRWNETGVNVYSGMAYTLCSTPTGLLVGGDFTQAGGAAVTNLARWDGTTWVLMEAATSGSVTRIVPDGTNYIFLGEFSSIAGIAASGVAQLSGTLWTALGQGVYPVANCAARIGTNLYVAGNFQIAGGRSAGFIARWTGVDRLVSLLPGKSTSLYGGIRDMALGPDGSLVVAGWFPTAGETIVNNLARYDGTNWSAFGEGFRSNLNLSRLAQLGTNLYVAGYLWQPSDGIVGIARWEGTNLVSVGGGLSNGTYAPIIYDVAAGQTNIFVVGSFDRAGGAPITNIACWDGLQWTGYDYSSSQFIRAIAVRGEHPAVCEISGGPDATIRAKEWDGIQWTNIGTPLIANGYAYVNKMIWAGTNLFVAGRFVITNGFTATNLMCWNGLTWSSMNSPLADGATIMDLAWNGTNLFMSGGSEVEGAPVAAKWDGTNWSRLGSGVKAAPGDRPWVGALAIRGRDLYLGGEFTTAGGKPADNLALWHDFPAVTLGTRGWQTNGKFGLRVYGSRDQLVQVQSSTNFQNWDVLGEHLPDSDPFDFDQIVTQPQSPHLYRLRLLP